MKTNFLFRNMNASGHGDCSIISVSFLKETVRGSPKIRARSNDDDEDTKLSTKVRKARTLPNRKLQGNEEH